MAANKPSSSSPIPSSRPNPNSRNSEIKDPMRRSFTGNPFSKPSSIVANSRGGGGFNPKTPANSPSDFPRRSSTGRESLSSLRDFEDKENSKDSNLKSARVRSPASASKGAKNFMSPTISAASKFAEISAPRKKILAERNEPVRSSVSFSEAKVQVMEDNDSKPEISLGKKKTVTFSDVRDLIMEENDFSKPEMGLNQIESSHDSTITDLGREETVKSHSIFDSEVLFDSKSDVSSLLEAATKEKDCVNLDSTFKISPRTSCPPSSPMLAPLDADPLMPPYDPKTNYLSPRPQFLHYRPNPRIESILNKVKDGKRLEESFASENSSDSEDSEILSEDSQKESEEISSDETVKETNEEEETAKEGDDEAVEEEEELNVSEPNPPFSTHRSKEESVQAEVESKSKFFTRSKFIAFVLVLMFACLSISVSDSQLAADLSLSTNFYVPPEVAEFAKVTFEELVRKSQLWSANSIAYICKLISSFRGMHTLGPLQYGNLTVLLEKDHLVDGHLKFVQKDASADFNYENDFLASIRERNLKSEPLQHEEIEDDENIEEIEDDENIEEENSPEFVEQVLVHQEIEVHDNINEASEDHTDSQSEEVCSTPMAPVIKPDLEAQQTQEIVESNVETDIKLQSNNIDLAQQHVVISESTENQPAVKISEVIENQPNVAVLEVAEIQPEVSFADEPQGETDLNSESDASSANLQNSATFNGSENNYLTKNVVGISLSVLLSLLAATSFFTYANSKKGKPSTSLVDQPALTKKFSPISVSAEHTFHERLSSRNWQTEVEMVGESCPSEMSSFKGSSYRKELSEAQSQERKQQPSNNYRRESLASSEFSMGSPSYGSFTTYEKISSKVLKGWGEDEVVTPVRRSSRIRKQVTSS